MTNATLIRSTVRATEGRELSKLWRNLIRAYAELGDPLKTIFAIDAILMFNERHPARPSRSAKF